MQKWKQKVRKRCLLSLLEMGLHKMLPHFIIPQTHQPFVDQTQDEKFQIILPGAHHTFSMFIAPVNIGRRVFHQDLTLALSDTLQNIPLVIALPTTDAAFLELCPALDEISN